LFTDVFLGQNGYMFVLEIGMLLSVVLAVVVVCVVAVPARREGRGMLTPKGDDMVSMVREKTGEALEAARDKVSDVTRVSED